MLITQELKCQASTLWSRQVALNLEIDQFLILQVQTQCIRCMTASLTLPILQVNSVSKTVLQLGECTMSSQAWWSSKMVSRWPLPSQWSGTLRLPVRPYVEPIQHQFWLLMGPAVVEKKCTTADLSPKKLILQGVSAQVSELEEALYRKKIN